MKFTFSYKSLHSVMVAICISAVIWMPASASAIMIDFQEADGYTIGELNGQPTNGTQWVKTAGDANSFEVVGGGNDHILIANTTPTANNSLYHFYPTDDDLNTIFDSSSSILNFRFDLKWTEINSALHIGRFYVGGVVHSVFMLSFDASGKIQYYSGANLLTVKDAGGSDFIASSSTWYTVEGQIDYKSKTYTLTVNGVAQNSTGSAFNFKDATASTAEIDLFSVSGNHVNYTTITYDNIELVSAPSAEPDSGFLIDFQEADGYTNGDLDGQPTNGTQWIHAGGDVNTIVVIGGGSDKIVEAKPITSYSVSKFIPSNDDLDITFDGNHSLIDFSFDIQWKSINPKTEIGRVYFGAIGTPAIRFSLQANGNILYGGANTTVTNSAGAAFAAAASHWYKARVLVDYKTKTYKLTVDGVEQNNGNAIDFMDSSCSTPEIFLFNKSGSDPNKTTLYYDNIEWATFQPAGTVITIK